MDYQIFRKRAIVMRKRGCSYRMIQEVLPVAKSTLSCWLREIPFKPNKRLLQVVQEAKLKSGMHKSRQRAESIAAMRKEAKVDIGRLSTRDLFMLGLGVYIGEGVKLYEDVRVINSDPKVIMLMIAWFQRIAKVPKENFVLNVHMYPDSDVVKIQSFWSELTGISLRQFGKVQVDKRSNKSLVKRRKLPYGTVHLRVRGRGKKEFGVLLHRRIRGWMEASLQQFI